MRDPLTFPPSAARLNTRLCPSFLPRLYLTFVRVFVPVWQRTRTHAHSQAPEEWVRPVRLAYSWAAKRLGASRWHCSTAVSSPCASSRSHTHFYWLAEREGAAIRAAPCVIVGTLVISIKR